MVKIVLVDAKDPSKRIDLGDTKKMMWRANIALADMGRAAAGLVPHVQAMGRVLRRMEQIRREQIAYCNLQWISGATGKEIREHLTHWTGSIFDLERFYVRFGCFPSQMDTERWGSELMKQYQSGAQWIDWDLLLMEKSPRIVQGVLFLAILILMLLERF